MAESSSADTMSCTRSVRLRSDGDIAPQSLSRPADAALPFLFAGYLPSEATHNWTFLSESICPRKSRGRRLRPGSEVHYEDVISPFEGYYTADKEKVRVAVNTWIRSKGAFDGVIDFDQVVKDPSRPTYIQAAYDKGNHLHPQDDGYKAMAESIDLALLAGKK